jgi:DNA oxidative demethylase
VRVARSVAGGAIADLFRGETFSGCEIFDPGAFLLPGFALNEAPACIRWVDEIATHSPYRGMATPGGHIMSVTTTSCGSAGWVSDANGYRYARSDPDTGRSWPAIPDTLATLARQAAALAGFAAFSPDACLINRYAPGARMSLHQDKNERDFTQPIVSVSLGLPAVFLWGGARRADRPRRLHLSHGDVVVWGGPARMRFHGVEPVPDGDHPLTGRCRINLTFRKAL